jgi:hypothetical protein
MKFFILKLFVFIAPLIFISFLADSFISTTLRKAKHKYYVAWNDLLNGNLQSDVLIYGSSRARAHIDCKILEDSLALPTYNLGLDGYTFEMQFCRHRLVMKNNKKPTYILMSLDYATLSQKDELYQAEQFAPYFNDGIIKETIKQRKGFDFWDYYLPLIRYTGNLSQLTYAFNIFLRPQINKSNRYKGYYNTNIQWTKDFEEAKKRKNHLKVNIDSSTLHLFGAFLKSLKENNINPIFVFTPVYIDGQAFISNKEAVFNLYQEFSIRYNIPLMDYSSDSICNNKKYFYNTTHLNLEGSTMFSKKLASDLKKYISLTSKKAG